MKRILIILLLLCSAFAAQAQNAAFGELFARYAGREGFTSAELGEKMMQMMSRRAASDDKALARLLDGIRSIRIVASKNPDQKFIDELLAMAEGGHYNLILSQSEGDQVSKFYFIDGGPFRCSEFLMITYGPKEQVVVDIYGEFDVKDISRLSAIRPM